MREYWILTKLQLLSLFGLNRARFSRDEGERKKSRKNAVMFLVMIVSLGYLSSMYSVLLAEALKPLSALPAMIPLIVASVSVFLVVFTVFTVRGVLFAPGDYDTLMSWPVSKRAIVAARMTTLYAYHLCYGAMFLVPALAVYAVYALPAWWFYPLALLLTLFAPAVPTAVGAVVGTLVTEATAGLKRSSILDSIVQIVFVFFVMALSMRTGSMTAAAGGKMALLAGQAASMYPPSALFLNAVAYGGAGSALLFLLLSLAALLIAALFVSWRFFRLSTRLIAAPRAAARVRLSSERSGALAALYRSEWKRYTSSTIYLTNTAFGVVMILAFAVLLAVERGKLSELLDIPGAPDLTALIPLVLGFVVVMSATTGSSISMEGKRLWIVRSLPVRARDWFLSKVLVSLTVIVPGILIAGVVIGLALRPSASVWPYLFVTPLAYALFAAVLGLAVNLWLPKLDWKNDAEVVKQSASAMVSVLGGIVLTALPIVLAAATGSAAVVPIVTMALFALAAALWAFLSKNAETFARRLH